jgi:hypothetical protein
VIPRIVRTVVEKRLSAYPAVALTGPRQAGKTTLARGLGGRYFDLEQAGDRTRLDLEWETLCAGAGLTILDNNYQTPQNDQYSIGLAQQISTGYAAQVDYVHSKGRNEPMTPQINYFEDPATGLPESPAKFGRPYPQYTNITMTTSTGKSQYDGRARGQCGSSPLWRSWVAVVSVH